MKRGPKPSGVQTVVYYRRVSPEWVDRLDAFMGSKAARDLSFETARPVVVENLDTKKLQQRVRELEARIRELEG